MEKKKSEFNVPNYGKKKRVKKRWRKPRGIDNKKRIRRAEFGATPKVGCRRAAENREKHPLGLLEVRIFSYKEFEKVSKGDMKGVALRLSGKLSKKSKEKIREDAKKLKIRVLN